MRSVLRDPVKRDRNYKTRLGSAGIKSVCEKKKGPLTRGELRQLDAGNLCEGAMSCKFNATPLDDLSRAGADIRLLTEDCKPGELNKLFSCVEYKPCSCSEMKIQELSFSKKDDYLWRKNRNPMTGGKVGDKLKYEFGPKWATIMHGFRGFLPRGVFSRIRNILVGPSRCCETCWISRLKKISACAIRKNILSGHGVWSYLADLKVLGGYDCTPNRADVFEEMKAQILDEDGREILWTKRMEKKVDECVDFITFRKHEDQISFRQFMEFRDMWALPGACSEGTGLEMQMRDVPLAQAGAIGGKHWKRKVLKGKFASCLGMGPDELVTAALTPHAMTLCPFTKQDEPARARGVVAADSRSYRRCSYLDKVMMKDYNGNKLWTTLGLNPTAKEQSRKALSELNADPTIQAVSLDQSTFDMSQRKEAVRYAMAALFKKGVENAREDLKDELEKLAEVELDAFDNAVTIFKDAKGVETRIPWKRGVPSGLYLTAILDSIINYAEAMVVADDLGVDVMDGRFQGDDAVLFTRKWTTGLDWSDGYAKYGLLVNGEKTWVSNERYDYLHEINGPEGAWGFPSRMCKTILWKKPELGGSGFKGKAARDTEYFTALLKAHRRGMANCRECAEHLLTKRLLAWTPGVGVKRQALAKRRAFDITNTPLAFSGLGFANWGRCGLKTVVSGVQEAVGKMVITGKLFEDTPAWRRCVKERLSEAFPMPEVQTAYYHVRIPRALRTKVFRMAGGGTIGGDNVRLQWSFLDYAKHADAWQKHVALEHALYDREVLITPQMVPDSRVGLSKMGADAAARLLHKEQALSMDLGSDSTSGEPYAAISNEVKTRWDAALNIKLRSCLLNMKDTALNLAQWAMKKVDTLSWGIRVAV